MFKTGKADLVIPCIKNKHIFKKIYYLKIKTLYSPKNQYYHISSLTAREIFF